MKPYLLCLLFSLLVLSCGAKDPEVVGHEREVLSNHKSLAVASLRRQNFPQALEEIGKAEELNGKDPEIYLIKGLIYFGLREYGSAESNYKKAISLKSDYTEARYNLCGLYLRIDRLDDAIKQCTIASSDPVYRARPKAFTSLGVAYFRKGNIAKAKENYERALQINPAFVYAHNELGELYMSVGRQNEAIEEFKKAISGFNAYDEAHYNLGLAYLKTGKRARACESFRRVSEISPGSELAVNANSYVLSICE